MFSIQLYQPLQKYSIRHLVWIATFELFSALFLIETVHALIIISKRVVGNMGFMFIVRKMLLIIWFIRDSVEVINDRW